MQWFKCDFILYPKFRLVHILLLVAATVVLSSTGSAAEWHGDSLGEFVEAGKYKGRPYYTQRDTEGHAKNYLYSDGKHWFVSNKLGKNSTHGANQLKSFRNSTIPPQDQWHYGITKGRAITVWKEDDNSLTLEYTKLYPKQWVEINGEGDMLKKVGGSLGRYRS